MNLAVPYRPTTLAQAGSGACLLMHLDDALHVVLSVGYDHTLGVALIHPPTIEDPYDGAIGILSGSIVTDAPTWLIEGARAVPSNQPTDRRCSVQPPPGALIVRPEGIALGVAYKRGQIRYFNMETGFGLGSELVHVLWFASWSIMAPVADEMRTVCTITVP